MRYSEFDEPQKDRTQRKRMNNKHNRFEATDKSSFGKESAKRHRKNDAKRISNQYRLSDFDDMDEFDDYETYERFSKR